MDHEFLFKFLSFKVNNVDAVDFELHDMYTGLPLDTFIRKMGKYVEEIYNEVKVSNTNWRTEGTPSFDKYHLHPEANVVSIVNSCKKSDLRLLACYATFHFEDGSLEEKAVTKEPCFSAINLFNVKIPTKDGKKAKWMDYRVEFFK